LSDDIWVGRVVFRRDKTRVKTYNATLCGFSRINKTSICNY